MPPDGKPTSRQVLLASAIALTASAAPAAPAPNSPADLSARIDRIGATATVRDLDDNGRFDVVLDQIAGGSANWITLAPRLVPGVDGADAEGPGIALAEALPIDPSAVLGVATPREGVIGIGRVCGVPFIETPPTGNAAYRKRALAALRRVRAPASITRRDQCRTALTAP